MEPPSQEERLQAVDRYRQWKRANGIGCLAWLLLVVLIETVLRQWLPESFQLLALAGVLALPPAWWMRKAYVERRNRQEIEKEKRKQQ